MVLLMRAIAQFYIVLKNDDQSKKDYEPDKVKRETNTTA